MPKEVHKAKFSGKVGYALFSTVTMSYSTNFMSRKELTELMKKKGYKKDAIRRGFKDVYKVKAKKARGRPYYDVSFPVYRLTPKGKVSKKKRRP